MTNAIKETLYSKDEIQNISDLFNELYHDSRGYVKIMSGNNRKGYFTIQKS